MRVFGALHGCKQFNSAIEALRGIAAVGQQIIGGKERIQLQQRLRRRTTRGDPILLHALRRFRGYALKARARV